MVKTSGIPDSEFRVGDIVRVIVNDRNTTQRTGAIQKIIWHVKEQKYNYYIEDSGKSISKRYIASDLELVTLAQNTA